VTVVCGVLLCIRAAAQDRTQFADPAAQDLFRFSRAAVGGGAVSKLKSLVMKGHSRVLGNDGALMPAAVEIKFLLPDNYLRIDSANGSDKVAGYSGKTVLSVIRQNGNVQRPPDQIVPQILRNERIRAARLLLGAATYAGPDGC
jgi:hypothetical protein